jgi:ketosteroid isomerase-like protein
VAKRLAKEHVMTLDLSRREIILMGAAATLACGSRVADPTTEAAMASTQSEVRALLDRRSEAIRAKDIERLMSVYAPDVVYFDLVPPLKYVGAAALRARFTEWFERWSSAIGQEVRDLNISASGEIAAAHMLIRATGTLKTGQDVGFWVRASDCCRRSSNGWVVTHEHISLPVDLASQSAVMDLAP